MQLSQNELQCNHRVLENTSFIVLRKNLWQKFAVDNALTRVAHDAVYYIGAAEAIGYVTHVIAADRLSAIVQAWQVNMKRAVPIHVQCWWLHYRVTLV